MEDIQKELSEIPLSELKELQDKLGLKAFQKLKNSLGRGKAPKETILKRANKNRPSEHSARRPVSKNKFAAGGSGTDKNTRDPRFDDLSGEFNPHIFRETYGFLKDVKAREKTKLQQLIGKSKNKKKKGELKQLYNRMEQQESSEREKIKQAELLKKWKKEEWQKVKEGKQPYFLKKAEQKSLLRAQQKKEMEEAGVLDKYTQRKNKKLAAKEKKRQKWKTGDS